MGTEHERVPEHRIKFSKVADAEWYGSEPRRRFKLLGRIRGKLKLALDHIVVLSLIVGLILADILFFVLAITTDDEHLKAIAAEVSIVIVSLFVVEIFARMVVFGRHFFEDFWMMMDALVVIGSLVCELLVPASVVGVIIFLRLTRIARMAIQLMRHGHVLRNHITLIFRSKKTQQTSLEYCISTLKGLQGSGMLDPQQLMQLQNVIDMLGSGKLYDAELQLNAEDIEDIELKEFLNNGVTSPQRLKRFGSRKMFMTHKEIKTDAAATDSQALIMNQMKMTGVAKCLAKVDNWNFDIFELDKECAGNTLVTLGYHLFESTGLLEEFSISPAALKNFLMGIQAGYRPKNPYHNQLHGADVLQATYWLLCNGGRVMERYELEREDLLSAFIAALIHDFEHPGINNQFCIRTGAPVAITYNDKSVLENHHISAAFRILQRDDCNIFEGVTEEKYRQVRDNVIAMVMATDMSSHFQHIAAFKASVTAKGGSFSVTETADKTRLMELVLHFADVSNPARPEKEAQRWTSLVVEEFFRQGDLERHKNFTISPMYDRNDQNVPKSQRGFLQYVVRPFYDEFVAVVADDTAKEELEKHLNSNKKYWDEIPENKQSNWSLPDTYTLPQPMPEAGDPEETLQYLSSFGTVGI